MTLFADACFLDPATTPARVVVTNVCGTINILNVGVDLTGEWDIESLQATYTDQSSQPPTTRTADGFGDFHLTQTQNHISGSGNLQISGATHFSGDKTAAITATLSGSALVGISIDALDHNANNGAGCQLHLRGSGTLDPSLRRITLTFSGTDCDGVYQNGSAVFTR